MWRGSTTDVQNVSDDDAVCFFSLEFTYLVVHHVTPPGTKILQRMIFMIQYCGAVLVGSRGEIDVAAVILCRDINVVGAYDVQVSEVAAQNSAIRVNLCLYVLVKSICVNYFYQSASCSVP